MASIARDKGGRKRVLFVGEDGTRKTIRLGRASMKQAETFKIKLEGLITGRFSGIDQETARWVAGLPNDMHGKLAALGLIEPRAAILSATLGEFLKPYIKGRADIKPGTVLVLKQAQGSLLDYFGPAKGNDKRLHFLSREDAQKVLDACPDAEWRLIFSLARHGGLHTPSETLLLRWSDVDWKHNRMTVTSPKTEHHEGKQSRDVPLFPELRQPLMEVFEQAKPGSEHVITRYRQTNCNLRTQLHRIIRRAGLKPWPRTFQNLCASRETELTESFPLHVVTSWIGNSQIIAARHYLQVTDEHLKRAAQNAAQSGAEWGSTERKANLMEAHENADLLVCAAVCDTVQTHPLAPRGFEPLSPG